MPRPRCRRFAHQPVLFASYREQIGHRESDAMRLGMDASVFRHERATEPSGELVRQHRLAGAFGAVETDLNHALAVRVRCSAAIHSLRPISDSTRKPP